MLASWSDGTAALVTARAGNGRLVVWNADLLSSTLPRSGFFVALVRELAGELLADRYGLAGALPPGTARLLPLPPQAERASALKLLGPDGAAVADFDVEERDAGLTWRWAPVAPPGVYRIVSGGQTVLAAASACPASESDLRPAQERAVTAALAAAGTPPGRAHGDRGGPARQPRAHGRPRRLALSGSRRHRHHAARTRHTEDVQDMTCAR